MKTLIALSLFASITYAADCRNPDDLKVGDKVKIKDFDKSLYREESMVNCEGIVVRTYRYVGSDYYTAVLQITNCGKIKFSVPLDYRTDFRYLKLVK